VTAVDAPLSAEDAPQAVTRMAAKRTSAGRMTNELCAWRS
jgi:hypothetical protein